MFTLKHDTTVDAIGRATKSELTAALHAAGIRDVSNAMKKIELENDAKGYVAGLAAAHAEKEAAAKAVHDAAVAADAADETKTAIKKAVLESLEKKDADLVAVFTDFREKAKEDGNLAYYLEWKAEGIFLADAKRRELVDFIGFIGDEIETPTKTFAEFVETLETAAAHKTERALDYSVSHSTSITANMRDEAKFEALRWMAKLLPNLVYAINLDLEKGVVAYSSARIWM